MTDIEMIMGLSIIYVWLVACALCLGIGVLCAVPLLFFRAWKQIKGKGDVNVRPK